jgi:hypothetical protein
MTWQLILQAITLLSIGMAIGLLRSQYVTKKELDKRLDELHEERKSIWAKIDQVHQWLWEMKGSK